MVFWWWQWHLSHKVQDHKLPNASVQTRTDLVQPNHVYTLCQPQVYRNTRYHMVCHMVTWSHVSGNHQFLPSLRISADWWPCRWQTHWKGLVQLFGPIWPIRFRAVRRHSVGHRHVAIKVQPAARELSGNPSLKHPHIAKWMILDDCAMAMQAQLH